MKQTKPVDCNSDNFGGRGEFYVIHSIACGPSSAHISSDVVFDGLWFGLVSFRSVYFAPMSSPFIPAAATQGTITTFRAHFLMLHGGPPSKIRAPEGVIQNAGESPSKM
jgi:hypothetical protein